MAFRFEMGPGEDRCTLHLEGVVTAADMREMITEQIARDAWSFDAVIDTSRATDIQLGFTEMLEQARLVIRNAQSLPPRGNVVILAPQPQAYGLARMYQSATDGGVSFRLEVATTAAEAEALLSDLRSRQLNDARVTADD